MIPTWKFSAVQVLGLACLGVVVGTWLKRKLPLLDRLNIPVPIVGGMVYAVATLLLRDRVVNFDADVVLRDLLMVAFMTAIGLSARLQLIRVGGLRVIWFLAISTLGALLQNLLGMGMARLLGLDLRLAAVPNLLKATPVAGAQVRVPPRGKTRFLQLTVEHLCEAAVFAAIRNEDVWHKAARPGRSGTSATGSTPSCSYCGGAPRRPPPAAATSFPGISAKT